MKRRHVIVAGLAAGVVASAGVMAAAARTAPVGRPGDRPIGPALAPDTGAGELLIAVVGGVFASRQEAEAANAGLGFGDLHGYYVVPVAQFQGLEQQVGEPGEFALVSVFRTQEGADAFAELAASFGNEATILPERVRSLGGLYAGLGQEANPDGAGPLVGPIAASLP
ncbi:MAG: hypothetical protein WB297_08090 [Actinomycetota bacterium]